MTGVSTTKILAGIQLVMFLLLAPQFFAFNYIYLLLIFVLTTILHQTDMR